MPDMKLPSYFYGDKAMQFSCSFPWPGGRGFRQCGNRWAWKLLPVFDLGYLLCRE